MSTATTASNKTAPTQFLRGRNETYAYRRFGGGPNPAGRPAAPPADAPPPKSAAQLAADALSNSNTDFIFDGPMEGGMDRALPAFTDFVTGMAVSGSF